MTAGQARVFVLLLLLMFLEVIRNPQLGAAFKGIIGGFWNLGGK